MNEYLRQTRSGRSIVINTIAKRFSTLSGPLKSVNRKTAGIIFRPVNDADSFVFRLWIKLLAYGSLLCTVAYGFVLFWPTGWVVFINPQSPANPANWAILACLLVLQSFVLLCTFAAVRASVQARNPVPLKPLANQRVAFVTTRAPGEPVELVETTLRAAKKITYRAGTVDVWLLDETDSYDLKMLCNDLGVRYFTRARDPQWRQVKPKRFDPSRALDFLKTGRPPKFDPKYAAKTKHGNFNAWLAYLELYGIDYDILAGVDTDQVPHDNYLHRLLGYFHDPDIAFVVGPQVYGNYRPGLAGLVTRWSESQASFFQSTIQRAANACGSAMLVGTNYAIRMSVIKQVGGFQPCITEDMATGLVIHANHNLQTGNPWKSVYTPDVLAVGEGPNGWGAYFSQQWRWAAGTFDSWRKLIWHVMPRYTPRRRLHYALILSFYPIVALTWLLAVLSSMLYLVFGASAIDASLSHVLSLYLTCMVLQLSLYFWNRRFNVSPHETQGSLGLAGMAMTALTGPVYLSAMVGVALGRRGKFVVTKKGAGSDGETDTLRTFKLSLGWLAVMAGLIGYGAAHGHVNAVMLSWSVSIIALCIIPLILGVRLSVPRHRQTTTVQEGSVI